MTNLFGAEVVFLPDHLQRTRKIDFPLQLQNVAVAMKYNDLVTRPDQPQMLLGQFLPEYQREVRDAQIVPPEEPIQRIAPADR